jgi:hypothetical protein
MTAADRQRRFRQRTRRKGLVRIELRVPKGYKTILRKIERELRETGTSVDLEFAKLAGRP